LKKRAIGVLVLVLLAAGGLIAYLRREHEPDYKPTPARLTGQVTTLAGTGAPQVIDGATGQAAFADPFGIAVDRAGNVLVSEGGKSNRIRRASPKGIIDTIAGASQDPREGAPSISGSNDRVTLDSPSAIAVDKSGNVVIADTSDNRIVRLSPKGAMSIAAGSGARGYRDGSATEAQFDSPIGVAVDDAGDIFVADTYNDRIRKISPDGMVSTVAGSGTPGAQDGNGLAASFDTPCGVAVDKAGNIFVADAENNSIRKITPDSTVTLFAGGARGRQDGKGPDATFDHPCGIVITHDGFLFITDESSGLIREITPDADVTTVAGSAPGFRNSVGKKARFNGPSGVAVDPAGNLYIADRDNYLIRKIVSASSPAASQSEDAEDKLIQPTPAGAQTVVEPMIPNLSPDALGIKDSFPWPLNPQDKWHEIAGVVGEARGAFGGVALDHLHSGLDVKGAMGEQALAVLDETVSSPIPNWGFNETGEGIHVGVVSYIHVRIGRDVKQAMLDPDKFKPRLDNDGKLVGVRVRRGTEFNVGDAVGTLNAMNHVHLNLGPWNAQANPIRFPFIGFKDTVAPVIESSGGIEILDTQGRPFSQKRGGRLVISGDVSIIVAAYDRVDGNAPARKLGLYRAGYQILNEDGTPASGFQEPLMNIDFSRLPADDSSVFVAYAPGSGVSAYGTPTKFRYIVTNVVKDGRATQGTFRTSALKSGNYVLKVIAEDYMGNRASGTQVMQPILIDNQPGK
jgi:sugar lactone lactonase YvrE